VKEVLMATPVLPQNPDGKTPDWGRHPNFDLSKWVYLPNPAANYRFICLKQNVYHAYFQSLIKHLFAWHADS